MTGTLLQAARPLGSGEQGKIARPLFGQLTAALQGAALTALMFLFVYNISFKTAPSLTTGRLVILALALALAMGILVALRHFSATNWVALSAFLVTLLYVAILYAWSRGADSTQLSRLLHFLLFSVLGALAFSSLLKGDLFAFVSTFSLATLVQALFIFYSFISSGYRVWLSTVLVQGGNVALASESNSPGFSNSSGALLSLIQGLGVFSALYAARLSRSYTRIYVFSAVAAVTAASTLLTGRTGGLMSAVFFAVFMLLSRRRHLFAMVTLIVAVGLVTVGFGRGAAARLSRLNPRVESLGGWAFEVFEKGSRTETWRDLSSQPVPALSLETFFGTGLVSLDKRTNASGNDSGYIQTYYALGVPATVMFYGALFALLMKHVVRSDDRILLSVLVVSMFAVEVKEPFIFKYVYPFFVLSVVMLAALKNEREKPRVTLTAESPELAP
jgi:hypothetical protein